MDRYLIGVIIVILIGVFFIFFGKSDSDILQTFPEQDQYYNERNTRITDLLMQADIFYNNGDYIDAKEKYRQAKRLSNHIGPSIYIEKYEIDFKLN
jgi:hypothetical protein